MTIRLLPACLLVAFAATASAGAMAALDANGDGAISPHEAAANPKVAEQFEKLDRNQDQKLDRREFSRFETDTSPRE